MPPVKDDEKITQLTDGTEAWRVDAVAGPANGTEWLLLKAEMPTIGGDNGEPTFPATESGAAQLASYRAGKRMDEILAKAQTTHQRQDTPTYDATDPKPFNPGKDQPNSTVNAEPVISQPGTGQPEVDAVYASLLKEAEVVVGHCDYLNSLALIKAEAEYAEWCKAKYSAEDKQKLLAAGKAMRNANGDPSYPIDDADDLSKAIKAVGRGGASHNAVRRHIMKRAKALGKSNMIPDNWQSDGSLAKDGAAYLSQPGSTLDGQMQPEDGPALGDGDSTPVTDGPGSPGSATWEAEDARRLIAAGQLLAQVCQQLCDSRDRESAEVAAGHFDDQANVCDLQDAKCAAEYALGIVARLAFHEEAEAGSAGLAKQERLTGAAVDVIRRSISLLKSGELDWLTETKQPAPDGSGTDEEVWSMDLTKEDLAAVVGEAVKPLSDRLDAFEKAQADKKAAKKAAKQLAKEQGTAKTDDPADGQLAKGDGEAKTGTEAPADGSTATLAQAPDVGELVKAGILEAFAPIDQRLAALEGRPAGGGPLVGAGAGGFPPGAPRGGGREDVPPEILDLRSRIQKASADGDTITETRLRKELGNNVLAVAWEARGYPASAARGQAMRYTENAASA